MTKWKNQFNALTSPSNRRTCAIIVAYRPDTEKLSALVRACLNQCSGVVLINNGNPKNLSIPQHHHLNFIQLEDNIGLASAQNLGVKLAKNGGYNYIVFFDQDSHPEQGLVSILSAAFENLETMGFQPAAVGPCLIDNRDGIHSPFVRFHLWGIERIFPSEATPFINCDFLISSGLFTSITRFHTIGMWEDDLFVDNVDMEWSFRARHQGYRCFGISAARLSHSLGTHVFRFKFLGWNISIYTHAPQRQYYINRNRIALYQRPYVPLSWKIQDMVRGFLKSALICLAFKPRLENLHAILHGIIDGLRGRLGGWNENQQQASDQALPRIHSYSVNKLRAKTQADQQASGKAQTGSN